MTEAILLAGASNALLAASLAGLAWVVHRSGRRPALAHGLWVLVLLRLVVPPVLTLPLLPVPAAAAGDAAPAGRPAPAPPSSGATAVPSAVPAAPPPAATPADAPIDAASPSFGPGSGAGVAGPARAGTVTEGNGILGPSRLAAPPDPALPARDAASPPGPGPGATPWPALAVLVWAAGSLLVLGVTVRRTVRFHRRLLAVAVPAAEPVRRLADELAVRFGLRRAPAVLVCPGRLGPLVWWAGGRVRIVVPAAVAHAPDAAGRARLRWILAHELAHVRRRDHLVRWLECGACALCWWNPVAWWVRGRLRLDEEACCDALVLRTLEPRPRAYAGSLLSTVQLLAHVAPAAPRDVPALASGLNAGDALERRISMIARHRPSSRRRVPRRLLLAATALVALPLGLSHAQDVDAVGERLRAAVSEGELREEHAAAMMERLRELADRDRERRAREEARARREAERRELLGRIEALAASARTGELDRAEAERMIAAATAELAELRARDHAPREGGGRHRGRDEHRGEAWDHRPHFAALFERVQAAEARGELESEELETVWRELKLMLQLERIDDNLEHGTLPPDRADEMVRDVEAELAAVREERRRDLERFVARTEAAADRGELSRERARDMIRAAEARAERMHELVHGDPGAAHGHDTSRGPDRDARALRDVLEELRMDFERRTRRVEEALARGELTPEEADRLRHAILHRRQLLQIREMRDHGAISAAVVDAVIHSSELVLAEFERDHARALAERIAEVEAAADRGVLSRDRALDRVRELEERAARMHELVHADPHAWRDHDGEHDREHERAGEHDRRGEHPAEEWERERDRRLEPAIDRLRAAVERGEMEPRGAEWMLEQAKREVAADLRREAAERLEGRSRELLRAVEAGRLSADEAMERLAAAYDAVRAAEAALR